MRRPDAKGLDPAVYHGLTAHLGKLMGARETLTGSQDQQPRHHGSTLWPRQPVRIIISSSNCTVPDRQTVMSSTAQRSGLNTPSCSISRVRILHDLRGWSQETIARSEQPANPAGSTTAWPTRQESESTCINRWSTCPWPVEAERQEQHALSNVGCELACHSDTQSAFLLRHARQVISHTEAGDCLYPYSSSTVVPDRPVSGPSHFCLPHLSSQDPIFPLPPFGSQVKTYEYLDKWLRGQGRIRKTKTSILFSPIQRCLSRLGHHHARLFS